MKEPVDNEIEGVQNWPISFRLYALQEKSAKKAEMMKWLQEQAVDHETGQALFRPQTGRGPKRKEEREATEIHLRLYELQ